MNSDCLPDYIWQFSSASQEHLRRLLRAVKPNDNPWVQQFLPKMNDVREKLEDNETEAHADLEHSDTLITNEIENSNFDYEEFRQEIIDVGDPLTNFDLIVNQCLKDRNLYYYLAKSASISSIEKICSHIFSSNDLNANFLDDFYKYFIPTFLKKERSLTSLSLVVKAYESNSIQFKKILIVLLNNQENSKLLQEFVTTLNATDKTNFIKIIIDIDVTNELFIINIFPMYVAYKDCVKTDDIQKYVSMKLTEICIDCTNSKDYGRFLLTYINSLRSLPENCDAIEQLINRHATPFKRACLNAFKGLGIS